MSHFGYKIAGNCLVVLQIPKRAKTNESRPVTHRQTAKYRCDEARVMSIVHLKKGKHSSCVSSSWDTSFKYRVGKKVRVSNYDCDSTNVCSNGIHYFLNPVGAYVYWSARYDVENDGRVYDEANDALTHEECIENCKRKLRKRVGQLLTQ